MAAPMKVTILSKSCLFTKQIRTIFLQSTLLKYNRGRPKNQNVRGPPLDEFIRIGKHENDTYEKGMDMYDRFVDPTLTKKPRVHPEIYRSNFYTAEHPYGKIYEKKPFPLVLKAGKRYLWCACGKSHSQPICDGTHKLLNQTAKVDKEKEMYPMTFEVEEDGEYWLCNCKQSKNRPFCDGTHRSL